MNKISVEDLIRWGEHPITILMMKKLESCKKDSTNDLQGIVSQTLQGRGQEAVSALISRNRTIDTILEITNLDYSILREYLDKEELIEHDRQTRL